jgi:transcriptional regulator GlxA family with amidase domain
LVKALNRHFHFQNHPEMDIHLYLASIRRELHNQGKYFKETLQCFNLLLLYSLAQAISENGQHSPVTTKAHHSIAISQAREYIYKNFRLPISLGQIAFAVNRSEGNLARQFKKEIGVTVFRYLRRLRIEEAKSAIVESHVSLSEISRKCGFQSLSFFSKCFKAETGISPSGYRNSLASKHVKGPLQHLT